MLKKLLSLLALLTFSVVSYAQSVSGKVTDSNSGAALPGVSVQVVGTGKGAATDADGNYSINGITGNVTLKFSFIGYEAATAKANGGSVVNIALKESGTSLNDVIVVGSRSTAARTNTSSPVPVDIITPKELKGFSQVDLGQIMNYVAPSFTSNRQTVADGTDHVDPASLRGLGPDQVLVLVNGKRRHTSALMNINGTVGRGSVGTDMNVIPVAAIERIEVLRDGAAAQYGSDAIAGVINVVLKKEASGLAASVTTGENITTMNYTVPTLAGGTIDKSQKLRDGRVIQFDISKGFKLGENGRVSISGQYNDHGATNRSGIDNAPTIYLGASAGFPGTPAGLTQDAFRTGLLAADAKLVETRQYNRQNMIFGNSSAQNIGIFANGGINGAKGGEFYFSGGITYRTGAGFGNNRIPVSRGQQPLKADGTLANPDGFLPGISSVIRDQSAIVGYKGKINNWSLDLSNTYGKNTFNFSVFNSGNATLPNADLQQNKFDAGQLRFDQNTVNLDVARLFEKVGAISGLNVAFGAEFRRDHYQITKGELNSYSGALSTDKPKIVPGAPLTAGGPANGTATALPGAQVFPGFQPSNEIDKARTNIGLYTDIEGEIANRLLIGLAGRYENYSDFGGNLSGKATARLKITDAIGLRGSLSTGFRAPSLHQRYFQNTSTQFVGGVPSNTLTVNNDSDIARKTVGVDALRPETSVSYTVGVTARHKGFSATVDAYQIKIADRIVYSGAYSRALLGFTADQFVGINNVNFFANAANTTTRGIDIVLNQKIKFGKENSFTITAAMNFNENKVDKVISTALIDAPKNNDIAVNPDNWFKNRLFDRQQISRVEVFMPQNKVNLSGTLTLGKMDITLRAVRFGAVKYIHNVELNAKKADGTYWNAIYARDAAGNAFIDQTFDPVVITDLILAYRISQNLNFSIGANNLLDVYPKQIFIDPRNATGSLDYVPGRDASNRGRLLFHPNQGGYNGRFVFARLAMNF